MWSKTVLYYLSYACNFTVLLNGSESFMWSKTIVYYLIILLYAWMVASHSCETLEELLLLSDAIDQGIRAKLRGSPKG